MTISKQVLNELINNYQNPEDLRDENGLLKQLTKALPERAMKEELTDESGFAKNDKSSQKTQFHKKSDILEKPADARADRWK